MIHFDLYQKKKGTVNFRVCQTQNSSPDFTPTQRKERSEKSKFPDFSKQPKNIPLIGFRIFSRGNKAQKGF